jgi:hypothetical protein
MDRDHRAVILCPWILTNALPQERTYTRTSHYPDVNTLFFRNAPDPKFAVEAFIGGWTFFQADGQESSLQGQGVNCTQNAVQVNNCASIRFVLAGERVSAIAQINIFIL